MILIKYLLSKILPILFSPLGFCLIFSLIFILRKKKRYFVYAISSILIFSNGIISGILIFLIEYPWQRLKIESIENVEAIVVLSGGRKLIASTENINEWHDPDRFFGGIDLYKAGKAKKLIFTGGFDPLLSNSLNEGELNTNDAITLGIPPKDIISTSAAFNTYQESKALKKLFEEKSFYKKKEIILVTSAFHMMRAKKVFERDGFIVTPFPVDFQSRNNLLPLLSNPLNFLPSEHHLYKSSIALREFLGRLIYLIWK